MQKNGEILKAVLTMIVAIIAVIALAFAAYVYILPESIQIVQKHYDSVDIAYYNVSDNELNGEWLETQQHSVEKEELNRYEILKDFYKGRDNPFGNMTDDREEIIDEQRYHEIIPGENLDEEIPIE